MMLSEIKNQSWQVSDNIFVETTRLKTFDRTELEFHVNLVVVGFDDPLRGEIVLDCNIQKWITKLAKNPSFKLKRVIVTSDSEERILSVGGTIYDTKLLVLRNHRINREFTEEQKMAKREIMKKALDARKLKK